MLGIVSRLLNLDPASVPLSTSFIDLGLDSIGGVRLAGELEAHLGYVIDPMWILDYPTVQTLAIHIERTFADENPVAAPLTALGGKSQE